MIKIHSDEKWKNLINEKKLQEILEIFLKQLFKTKPGISVYITDDTEIQRLNKKFRNKDSPTDILSWSYNDNDLEILANKSQVLVGEIALSADRVLEQSIENGWDFSTELIRLLAHGCVHIFGLDHENSENENSEMLELEKKLLKIVGLTNIY